VLKLVTIGLLLSGCIVGEVKDFNESDDTDPTPDPDPDPEPVATGSLRVTLTTTTQPGAFAPRNAVAIWIEDAAGTFVKTIDRHSGVRTQHLVAWNAAAGAGDTDGVSGASRLDHATPITFNYKLKGRDQQVIPDGTYTIRMESTEVNAVAANENNQGTFTFTKGSVADTQTGLSNGGFENVSLEFTPP
jgi:hypothetical protein